MNRLCKQRTFNGWTRTELGRRSRIHPGRVGAIEAGRAVPPSGSVELKRLARALGWTEDPALLLEEVED